jgi:hypothetical protein
MKRKYIIQDLSDGTFRSDNFWCDYIGDAYPFCSEIEAEKELKKLVYPNSYFQILTIYTK